MKATSVPFVKSLRDFYDNYNLDVRLSNQSHDYPEQMLQEEERKIQEWLLKRKDNQLFSYLHDLAAENIFEVPQVYLDGEVEEMISEFLAHIVVRYYLSNIPIQYPPRVFNKSVSIVVSFS